MSIYKTNNYNSFVPSTNNIPEVTNICGMRYSMSVVMRPFIEDFEFLESLLKKTN